MQRAPLCSLVLASTLLTTPTFAQQAWDFAGPEAGPFQARAGVCPLDDAETGNFLCFTLSCDKNGPLQWGILAAGEGMPERIPTRVEVEDYPVGELVFRSVQREDYGEWRAAFDGADGEFIVENLQDGTAGALVMDLGRSGIKTLPFSLSGSTNALTNLSMFCDRPTETVFSNPDLVVREEISEICSELDGKAFFPHPFAERVDLDQNGQEDLIFDYGAVECEGVASLFCGTGGCQTAIFMARGDGDYNQVFNDTLIAFPLDTLPRATLSFHGSLCGNVGVDGCQKRYVFMNAQMVEK